MVRKFLLLFLLSAFALASCNTNTDEARIATAVALTVAARESQIPSSNGTPEPTPAETVAPASEPTPSPTPTQPAAGGPTAGCLKANLLGETIPDDTILKPGEIFTKSWTVKNSGTCTWDQTYKLVFWGGDLMGGAYVYNFPTVAIPDQVVEIPIVLYAPEQPGTYRGYWRLQSPNGIDFGVGEYDQSMWVQIVVSDAKRPGYGVTNVTYRLERDPQYGCPANVTYTVYATITVSGPVTIAYHWVKSDDTAEQFKELKFDKAGSQTVKVSWQLNRGVVLKTRWVQLIIDSPEPMEFGRQEFYHDCHSP